MLKSILLFILIQKEFITCVLCFVYSTIVTEHYSYCLDPMLKKTGAYRSWQLFTRQQRWLDHNTDAEARNIDVLQFIWKAFEFLLGPHVLLSHCYIDSGSHMSLTMMFASGIDVSMLQKASVDAHPAKATAYLAYEAANHQLIFFEIYSSGN